MYIIIFINYSITSLAKDFIVFNSITIGSATLHIIFHSEHIIIYTYDTTSPRTARHYITIHNNMLCDDTPTFMLLACYTYYCTALIIMLLDGATSYYTVLLSTAPHYLPLY